MFIRYVISDNEVVYVLTGKGPISMFTVRGSFIIFMTRNFIPVSEGKDISEIFYSFIIALALLA
jgi:hypothetical protein